MLDAGGEYAFRIRGEEHVWTPDSIAKLQHATRSNKYETYKEYAKLINDQTKRHLTLRGLFEFRPQGEAIPLDEVEPVKEIVKRFATGAISLGAISVSYTHLDVYKRQAGCGALYRVDAARQEGPRRQSASGPVEGDWHGCPCGRP